MSWKAKVNIVAICVGILLIGMLSLQGVAKVKLVYGFKGAPGELDVAREIVNNFNKSHPDIEVTILDMTVGGNWLDKLTILFAAGNPPDIIRMEYQRSFGYISEGLVRPLDEFVQKDKSFNLKDFFPGVIGAHTVGGKLYAIPQEAQPFTMFVNTTRLEEFGMVFPGLDWTIDELLEMARKSTKDTNGDGKTDVFGWQFDTSFTRLEPFFMAFGGRILNADKTRFMLDSAEVMRAMRFLRDAACVYRVKGGSFTQGNVVFYSLGGPWMVPGFRNTIKNWDWDILPVPGGPGGRGTTLGSDGYHIATACRHPEEAWEFIKYITSAESLTLMSKEGAVFPARGAVAAAYVNKKPSVPPYNLKAYMKGIEIGKATQVFKELVAAESLFNKVLGRVWTNEISPDQAVRELMPQLDALLKK